MSGSAIVFARLFITILILIGLGIQTTPVKAITYLVTSNSDQGDAIPGDTHCADAVGLCTLRAAIEEINASGFADSIYIQDMAIDAISINSPLIITRAMTITGQGCSITEIRYPGTTLNTIFDVRADLTLNDVKLRRAIHAIDVATPDLEIYFNNSVIRESHFGLRLTDASSVNFFASSIEYNKIGLNISGQGEVLLDQTHVTNNLNESAGCAGVSISDAGSRLGWFGCQYLSQ
jgi:hypothetical protein